MKKLTQEEFETRTREVFNASKIFGHITGGDITKAFELYQEIIGEEKLSIFISSSMGNKPPTILDRFVRPKCPECNKDMKLRVGAKDPDGKDWSTAWVCADCKTEYYSEKTPTEWMKELEKKDVPEQ